MSVSRHTAYNIVGAVIPIILALVTVPIYLRLIGTDRYGVLSIAWLLLGYFGLFDLGLGRATSYRIAALRDAPPQAAADTFWAALAVNIGMGVVGALILWGAGHYFFGQVFKVKEALRPEILKSVPLLALSVPLATVTGVFTGALQGRERFLATNMVSIISTTLFQLFPLSVAWIWGPNLSLLLTAALFARLMAALVSAYQCHLEFTRGLRPRLVTSEIPLLLKYGGWVSLTSIFGPILAVVDRFAIGAVLGAGPVTSYTVPYQLAQRLSILPVALTNAMFPRMSAAGELERRKMGANATNVLCSVMTPIVVAGLFLMQPFMKLWVGPSLSALAVPVGRILLVGFWINGFAIVPYARLQASGRPDLVTKMLLLEIPPYIAALYFSLGHFGVVGCAVILSIRNMVDYTLLTLATKGGFYAPVVLACNFAVILIALFCGSQFSPSEPLWWLCAIVLGLVTLTMAWRNLPVDLRPKLADLHRYLPKKA